MIMARTRRRRRKAIGRVVAAAALILAVAAPPATAAGGGNIDDGTITGQVSNVTPYTWTFVQANFLTECLAVNPHNACGFETLPGTVAPGQSFNWTLYSVTPPDKAYNSFDNSHSWNYAASFTYKANTTPAPEYVTVVVSQTWAFYPDGAHGDAKNSDPNVNVYNTSAPPSAAYDPWLGPDSHKAPDAPITASPQVWFTQSSGFFTDVALMLKGGDFTVDAATDPPALVNMLDAMCDDAQNTTCSFVPSGQTAWTVGPAVLQPEYVSCGDESNQIEIDYVANQSASVSAGGGVSASTEVNLFDVVSTTASIGVEAAHTWGQTKSFRRSTYAVAPPNSFVHIWVAPTVASITGTLTITTTTTSNGSPARYTISNYGQTQQGIGKDDLTPDFSVMTRAEQMTDQEVSDNCGGDSRARAASVRPARAQAARRLGAPRAASQAGLFNGRRAARVRLGYTEAQVLRRMGRPRVKASDGGDCKAIDPRCDAPPARGGTLVYPRMSIALDARNHVHTIVYRGLQKTRRGVGVGSSYTKVRLTYPQARCRKYLAHSTCTIRGTDEGRRVKTVYHFAHYAQGHRKCDRVMIHYVAKGNRP
jgi:hypothetical protein